MTTSAKHQNALFSLFEEGEALTLDFLTEASGIERRQCVKSAGGLIYRGLLERVENGVFILTEAGVKARQSDHVLTSGPIRPDTAKWRRPQKRSIRQRAWNAMRVFQTFSVPDLVCAIFDDPKEGNYDNLWRYCRALSKSGHLFELPTREAGTEITSNGFKRYRLMNDTGEIAPTYRNTKKEVFDHNTKEVFSCQAPQKSSKPATTGIG